MVEIESHWTATRPESHGIYPSFGDATQPKSPALRFAIGRATPHPAARVEERVERSARI